MSLLNKQIVLQPQCLLQRFFSEAVSSYQENKEVNGFLPIDDGDHSYHEVIHSFEKIAFHSRQLFLSVEPEEVIALPDFEFVMFLNCAYQDLLFYPNEEILVRFEALGCNRRLLTRFTPLVSLTEHLDLITADGEVGMPKVKVLLHIKDYLDKLASADIMQMSGCTAQLNGRQTTKAELSIYNAYRRRKYSGGAPLQYTMNKRGIDQFMDDIESIVGNKGDAKNRLLKIAGGNTDKLLFQDIEGMCTFEKTPTNKRRFVPLFQLLTTKYAFFSKMEHQRADRFYGQCHPTYLAKRYDHVTR